MAAAPILEDPVAVTGALDLSEPEAEKRFVELFSQVGDDLGLDEDLEAVRHLLRQASEESAAKVRVLGLMETTYELKNYVRVFDRVGELHRPLLRPDGLHLGRLRVPLQC